jgi:hypothetical protein
MGTWDIGSFDNDQAMDWAADLTESDDLSLIEEALGVDERTLDECSGVDVLAAAEVVAALKGKPSAGLPEDVVAWVAGHSGLNVTPLLPKARQLVQGVLAESCGLRQLWEENQDECAKWKATVVDLIARLK